MLSTTHTAMPALSSFERKLNKHATTFLIGGLFLSLSVLFYFAFCSLPCDDVTSGLSRADLRDAQNKAFWNRNILAPSRDLVYPEVVFIMSAPDNLMGRDTIRETWAKDLPNTVLLRFIIGTGSLSTQQHSNIHRENFIHSDLLLLKSVNDSYGTLTLKLLESFKWLDRHVEFTHLIKADEDSFVRVDRLAYELQKKPKERFYWGFFDGRAHVKKAGKWAEADWILCDRYLPYALGGGYVLSSDLVHYVSSNSKFLKLFNSEDVSLGTWLGPLDIKRSHDTRFDTEYKSRGCKNSNLIMHKQTLLQMRELHNNLLKMGQLCSKEVEYRKSYVYNWNALPSQCCKRPQEVTS